MARRDGKLIKIDTDPPTMKKMVVAIQRLILLHPAPQDDAAQTGEKASLDQCT
jgi:hypothetical protein